jgi:hypothetical protein
VRDHGGTPVVSNLTQIAKGLRNAAGMQVDPVTGDLVFADNGIDGNDFGNEAWSADELDRIAAAKIGGPVENFGFPSSYVKTIDAPGDPVTVVRPHYGVQPLIAFEPLSDPVLTVEGSESEGPSGFTLAPPNFPSGLNHGVFIGFHGLFNQGGTANDENPLIFADPRTGRYFDFISNNEPNIGHLDEALATTDSLFLADISSTGDVFGSGGPGAGVIYQIKVISPQAASAAPVPHTPSLSIPHGSATGTNLSIPHGSATGTNGAVFILMLDFENAVDTGSSGIDSIPLPTSSHDALGLPLHRRARRLPN